MIVDRALINQIMRDTELSALVPSLKTCVTKGCCNRPSEFDVAAAKDILFGLASSTLAKIKDKLNCHELVFYLPDNGSFRTVKR